VQCCLARSFGPGSSCVVALSHPCDGTPRVRRVPGREVTLDPADHVLDESLRLEHVSRRPSDRLQTSSISGSRATRERVTSMPHATGAEIGQRRRWQMWKNSTIRHGSLPQIRSTPRSTQERVLYGPPIGDQVAGNLGCCTMVGRWRAPITKPDPGVRKDGTVLSPQVTRQIMPGGWCAGCGIRRPDPTPDYCQRCGHPHEVDLARAIEKDLGEYA